MTIKSENQKKISVLSQSLFSEKEMNKIVGEVQKPRVLSENNLTYTAGGCPTTNWSCGGTCNGNTCSGCNKPGR